MSLSDSTLRLRRDLRLINRFFGANAGDEVPGVRAGDRSRLGIPSLVNIVNDVFSLALSPGCLVMIRVDIVLLAHNDSSGKWVL
jgi:hypothetical protein